MRVTIGDREIGAFDPSSDFDQELTLPADGSGQEEIGDVGTRRQEHERRHHQEHDERRRELLTKPREAASHRLQSDARIGSDEARETGVEQAGHGAHLARGNAGDNVQPPDVWLR